MEKCCYRTCEKEATTKGFVLARNPKAGGKDIPTNVEACDEHKELSSFFPHVDEKETV